MGAGNGPNGHLVGGFAALAIGAVVLLETLFAGAITGASMNPARSLGPAMVSGQAGYLWAYVAGPLAGAVAGAFLYRLLGGAATRAPAG